MSRNSGDNPKSRENRRGGNSKYGAKKSKYLSDKPKGKEKTGATSAGLPKRQRTRQGEPLPKFDDKIRLNKYIANAGICSRREADTLISSGVVSVNGEVIVELGYKVNPTDVVRYDGATVKHDKKRYVLVNKPKEFTFVILKTRLKNRYTILLKKLVKNPCFLLERWTEVQQD